MRMEDIGIEDHSENKGQERFLSKVQLYWGVAPLVQRLVRPEDLASFLQVDLQLQRGAAA